MTALSPAVELTRDLLRCPSVTPEDAGALDVLERALNAAGFACARKIFHEAGTPDVDNLFARIGEGAPHLVFAGHTDVVPPGDMGRWRFDPFSGEVAEGRIFGRGASDMKGAIAAFAAAALEYLRRHGVPKGAISFLITGDEEGPSINGTPKLLDWTRERGERFDHCIVGEPTNVDTLGDMMKIGRRGSLNGQIFARGKQGHVAYPERAHNPLPALARVAAALSRHEFDAGTEHLRAHQSRSHVDRRRQSHDECDSRRRPRQFQHSLQRSLDSGEPGGARSRGRARGGGRYGDRTPVFALQRAGLFDEARAFHRPRRARDPAK